MSRLRKQTLLKCLDLFSGIGGFSLGFSYAGIKTDAFCEKDDFCQQVLKNNFIGIPIYDDIRTFPSREYARSVDVIAGGFPCQPHSVAGKRLGADDERDLWREMAKVIATVKPTWVVCENVRGLESLALNGVLTDLENLQYETITFNIPACAVNAPHQRQRLWIVGYSDSARSQKRKSVCIDDAEKLTPIKRTSLGCAMGNTNGSRKLQPQGHEQQKWRWTGNSGWENSEWLQSSYDGKYRRVKSGVCVLADGVPNRVAKITALGNSIVPQIAYRIGLSIVEAEAA